MLADVAEELELKTSTSIYGADIVCTATAIGHMADPSAGHLCPIGHSDSHQWGRDGNKALLKYILVKGVVYIPAVFEVEEYHSTPPLVTVALVQDTQTNGAQMLSQDCFGNYIGSFIGNATIQRELFHRERFIVHRQDVFDLSGFTTTLNDVNIPSYGAVAQTFEWFVPLNVLVHYSGGDDDITDIVDHSFHICAFSTVPKYELLIYPRGPVLAYTVSTRYFSSP